MKARPILFSGPMVRALLVGKKTQTRRMLKNPEYYGCPTGDCPHWQKDECNVAMRSVAEECPHGAPGDLLWVREGFSYDWLDVDKDGTLPPWYWADGNPADGDWTKPKPSIHMPRWASRLTLKLTEVRVQLLQDITEADAIAEGARPRFRKEAPETVNGMQMAPLMGPIEDYRLIWEGINGPGSWEANPWIWVLAFAVHQQNVDAFLQARAA